MQIEKYEISPKLYFILTETKIIACTPLQSSLVIYQNGNYKNQWHKLRDKIRAGEVSSIVDLIDYNRARVGGISQIQGLILVNTDVRRHISV